MGLALGPHPSEPVLPVWMLGLTPLSQQSPSRLESGNQSQRCHQSGSASLKAFDTQVGASGPHAVIIACVCVIAHTTSLHHHDSALDLPALPPVLKHSC